jgi:ribonucleoside-diphosphate reductase beta chain
LAFEMGAPKGLTKEEVKQYIRYIADRRLIQMGFKSNFDVRENPLPWVAELLAEGHTNFFEQRVSEYSVVGMVDDWGWEEHTASPSNN